MVTFPPFPPISSYVTFNLIRQFISLSCLNAVGLIRAYREEVE